MRDNYLWMYSFPMKSGVLDDDYYFYGDGSIVHFYDKTQNKLNIEEIVTPSSISEDKRKTMLNACPQELKEIIKQILQL